MTGHVTPDRLDAASGADRRALLEHVHVCGSCRSALAAADPSALFSLLALAPVPEGVLDAVSASASAAAAAARPNAIGLRARGLAAAAVLAFAALTGALTFVERPTSAPAAARVTRADVEVAPDASVSGVVDFTVGTTQVVMVYNGDLHL